jgi:hypothetical protein
MENKNDVILKMQLDKYGLAIFLQKYGTMEDVRRILHKFVKITVSKVE